MDGLGVSVYYYQKENAALFIKGAHHKASQCFEFGCNSMSCGFSVCYCCSIVVGVIVVFVVVY